MPIIIAAFIGGLVSAASSFVGRALIALGVGYVSYTGISLTLSTIHTMFLSNLSATGATALGFAGLLKIDAAFNIIMSAVVAKFTLNGLTSGTMKRFIVK